MGREYENQWSLGGHLPASHKTHYDDPPHRNVCRPPHVRPFPTDRLSSGRLPSPRSLLPLAGLLLLVLLAGCSAPGSISMDPVTDGELAERASRSFDRLDHGPDAGDDPEARMLREAIENGSATIDSANAPVREGLPFEHEGAYYDVSYAVVDEWTVTSVSLRVDYNASDPEGERIAYADLPAADRRALDALLPPREGRQVEGYDLGAATRYDDAELERSVLVSDRSAVVVYEGEPYPVRLDGTSEMTVETYRYTATTVADSPGEYAADLTDEYRFTLSGLSEEERAVVDAAVEDGYYADGTDDEAFRSVLETFRRHKAVHREETYGEWLVRYDGEVYWAQLEYSGYGERGGSRPSSGSGRETRAESG